MCHKYRFRDEIAAQLAIAKSRMKNNKKRREERHYYCESCKAWHITSTPKKTDP